MGKQLKFQAPSGKPTTNDEISQVAVRALDLLDVMTELGDPRADVLEAACMMGVHTDRFDDFFRGEADSTVIGSLFNMMSLVAADYGVTLTANGDYRPKVTELPKPAAQLEKEASTMSIALSYFMRTYGKLI